MDLPSLTKLSTPAPTVTDLQWCGFLDQYDETYDNVSSRAPKRLKRSENREFYFVTTTGDKKLLFLSMIRTACLL
jgi:translation initiation factor 3 subunit D